MLIRSALIVLGLAMFFACDDKDDDNNNNSASDSGKDSLSFVSDDGVAANGKGKIEVQFNQGDEAVTDQAGTEVTLTVVCGENSAEFKGTLSESGRAEIDVDVSDKKEDWGVTDWGTCKVSATINVDNEEIEAEEVELKTVGQEQGVCEKVGGCNGDDGGTMPSHEIGEEIGIQASLSGGTLKLHGCTAATLFTVSDTGAVSVATNNSVDADTTTNNFPTMFVLGTAGDKCVMQHTPAGGTATDHTKIVAASAENKAVADLNVTFADNGGKLKITLPAKPTEYSYLSDTVVAHVSKDNGATWGDKKADGAWGAGFDSSINWDAANEFGYQALLRISFTRESDPDAAADTISISNNAAYWSLHKTVDLAIEHAATSITVGQMFKVTGFPTQTQEWSISNAQVDEACGLHFFRLDKSSSGDYDRPMSRIKSDKSAIDSISQDDNFLKVLAIDKQGEAGYTADCTIKLNINGAIIAVGAKVDTARPPVTGITLSSHDADPNDPNNDLTIAVTLPAWDDKHGSKGASYHNTANDAGDSWSEHTGTTWGGQNTTGHGWNGTPTTDNQALVSVAVGTNNWWYYAGAQ